MKRNIFIAAILCLALFIMTGCGGNAPGSGDSGGEKTMVYGSGDYSSINPALYEHGEINSLLFSGLTAHDKDNNVVPGIAKSWDYDKATKTYTFHLRDDVKWHDGEKCTAEDVKFTLDAILNPDNQSEIAPKFEEIEKVEVVDPVTVKVILKTTNVAMLDYLTIGLIPKHLLEGKDLATDEWNFKPVGTGPFKFENWDKGQSITMVAFDDYYEGKPGLDKIIFKIVEDTKARALQLKSGELDFAQIIPQDLDKFQDDKDFAVYIMKTADYRGILYNFNSPFFKKHRELPNILSYAVDRKAILDTVLLGHGEVAYSPIQRGEYNDPDMPKFEYNPAKAEEELQKAGWKKGSDGIYEKDGEKLSFVINCREGDQVRIDMGNIASQQFKQIGVDMKVNIPAKADWKNQEAFLIGWGSPFDPDDHTYSIFGTGNASNYSYYSNPKIDEILKKARETDVKEERMKYYKEFQQEMAKDMPYTFFVYIDAIYVGKPDIKGITPETALGHHGVGIFWNIAKWTRG